MKSSTTINFIAILWFVLGFSYYPKWQKPLTEATISWDVSGYYHYLPAIFIYKDILQQDWMNGINQQYLPSTAYDQAIGHHNSGNKVNKYAIGQAVLFSPFFLLAHGYTTLPERIPQMGTANHIRLVFGLEASCFLSSVCFFFEKSCSIILRIPLSPGLWWPWPLEPIGWNTPPLRMA